jgi:hypothetical protein
LVQQALQELQQEGTRRQALREGGAAGHGEHQPQGGGTDAIP